MPDAKITEELLGERLEAYKNIFSVIKKTKKFTSSNPNSDQVDCNTHQIRKVCYFYKQCIETFR